MFYMLGLPNIKIVFNSFNTSISFSFNKDKKDIEKKEMEEDVTENEADDIEKKYKDYFVVTQENQAQVVYLNLSKSYRFNFDTRISKHQAFDIVIPPPEAV